MESLFLLIPLSVAAVVAAVFFFFRMNSDGQFDDDQGPAMSILMDDDSISNADKDNVDVRTPVDRNDC